MIAAEQRIGELLLAIPKQAGGDRKSENFKNPERGNFEKAKAETLKESGISKNRASEFQFMANHPESVAKAKAKGFLVKSWSELYLRIFNHIMCIFDHLQQISQKGGDDT